MVNAEKMDQQQRIASINGVTQNLFFNECSRIGIPDTDGESHRLIEKCFNAASILQDFLREKYEPFI